MNDLLGILGYLLLIVSGVFLDTPIWALIAIPLFLTGVVLISIFYSREVEHKLNSVLTFITLTGVILFSILTGFSAVTFNQYQGYLSRNPEIPWNWNTILLIVALNALASTIIYIGIRKANNYKSIELNLLVLPTLMLIPIILFIIKLLVISGSWKGASI